MTTPNRAQALTKTHKVLKRSYKHTPTKGDAPLMECLLFASCLENARYDVAQAAYAKLQGAFFDWNEIRVSTVKELAEVLHTLPEPAEAAARVKGVLQSVFESDYSFDLEQLKKQNIGAAVKRLQKLQGATPFNVAYATQHALGGHAIPVDKGTMGVLFVLGVVSEAEAKTGNVPGMERAIPKSKGQEFGALLHELGADFFSNPFSPSLRELLLSISSDAKERFPKRTPKKAPEPPPAPAKAEPESKKRGKDGKEKEKPKESPKAAVEKKPTPKVPAKRSGREPVAAHSKKKPAVAAKKPPAKALAKRKPR